MQMWKTLSRSTILRRGKFLTVEDHTVELPDGRIIPDWPWIITPDYINVVAVTDGGEFLCFRQTKYAIGAPALAPVGGYLEPGEDPLHAAQRELLEETGYEAPNWKALGHYVVDSNRGAGVGHLFLAQGARYVQAPDADDLEEQQLLHLSRSEVDAALAAGEFKSLSWSAVVALALRHLNETSVEPSDMLFDGMRARRSIRHYRPDPIPRETIDQLLDAATWAPSAHNRQPWRFAVLQSPAVKERLALAMGNRLRADRARDGDPPDAIERDAQRSRKRIVGAPVVIVACLSMRDMDRYPDERRALAERIMAIQSTSLAAQNLLLMAHTLGLGACWLCAPLFCPDVVRDSLALPEDWEPQALITLGIPADAGRARDREPARAKTIYLE